ncbi:hypothetical protein DU002_11315 [Corallincola holothuriorum]|uniref:Ubiquinone biosynthesis protein UbiH n=1 Tax=Corallincola holothuriorum TaxID=2282215 RepID=A0A368NI02_9GAMM|nr:OB-fold-containig protein [Corallincola holothuriorum]RCU49503.1 hypothetical protein DU002_11315 [Corallincola holothuriorum]
MDVFLAHLIQFPTVIYTVLLGVMLCYWFVAALGTVDVDVLDIDIDVDADVGALEGFAGLLLRLGLAGVPLTVVLTVIALTGWSICYFSMLLVINPLFSFSGVLQWVLGAGVAMVAFVASIFIAAQIVKPLRPLFKSANATSTNDLVGSKVVIRTSKVTPTFGEATLEDGGAGMVLRVRADETQNLTRGDIVVILEYLPETHAYRVMTEAELFKQ